MISTIAVPLDLLLPNVQDADDAAAREQIKDLHLGQLCNPPVRSPDASVRFTFMPDYLTARHVLGSGLLPNGHVSAMARRDAA